MLHPDRLSIGLEGFNYCIKRNILWKLGRYKKSISYVYYIMNIKIRLYIFFWVHSRTNSDLPFFWKETMHTYILKDLIASTSLGMYASYTSSVCSTTPPCCIAACFKTSRKSTLHTGTGEREMKNNWNI